MAEFNPVLVKELRGRMRGTRAFVVLAIFLAILSGATLLFYIAMAGETGSDLNAGRRIGQALFFLIAVAALIGICIITPTLTAGGIAGEKERQTFDLLLVSQISPWQIVLGKLGAALAFALLIILSVVPLMSLAFLFGGVSLSEVLIALIAMVVTAVCYACVGIFWSATMRSTLGANSLALGSITVWLLGIPFLALIAVLIFGFSSGFWNSSGPVVYLNRLFLSAHPFIALFLTETSILEGKGAFVERVNLQNGGQVAVPSAWLLYVFLSLLFSALLLLLSVRMVRPTSDAPVSRRAPGQERE